MEADTSMDTSDKSTDKSLNNKFKGLFEIIGKPQKPLGQRPSDQASLACPVSLVSQLGLELENVDISQLGLDEAAIKAQRDGVVVSVDDSLGRLVTTANKERVALTRERSKERVIEQMPGVMIQAGFLDHACNRPVSRKVFESTDKAKPGWAVQALVLLRDQGVCQVCHDEYGRSGVVVRLKLEREGAQYDEENCIGVCPDCAKVWPDRKGFYNSAYVELDRCKQFLYVLKRRGRGNKNDVRVLSKGGLDVYREMLLRVDALQLQAVKDDKLRVRVVSKVQGLIQTVDREAQVWDMVRGLRRPVEAAPTDNKITE